MIENALHSGKEQDILEPDLFEQTSRLRRDLDCFDGGYPMSGINLFTITRK